jgi:hypothetical protein
MPVVFDWAVAAFLAVFVIVVVLLIRMSTKARKDAAQAVASQENPNERFVLKFVEDPNGVRIGETVAVEGDEAILKDARGFLAVPVADLSEAGEGLKLGRPIDETAARQRGEAWRERSHKVITYNESELPKDESEA